MDPMNAMTLTPMGILKPYMRGLATAFITAVGASLCGMVGSLAYPIGGSGMLTGIVIGMLAFGSLGFFLTGFWKDAFPAYENFNVDRLMPESIKASVGSRPTVHLLLKIISVENVKVQGHMPWSTPDLYVETTCGQDRQENPTHNTCVQKPTGGVVTWNEQVRLRISPFENQIMCKIKNQDLFGSSDVGYVVVDVMENIYRPPDGKSFPKELAFKIQAGEQDQLKFIGGDKVPKLTLGFVDLKKPADANAQIDEYAQISQVAKPQSYGAADHKDYNPRLAAQYISSLQFTDRRIADNVV